MNITVQQRASGIVLTAASLAKNAPADLKWALAGRNKAKLEGKPVPATFVKGLPDSWKGSVSRNLTADRERGLGAWSDAEIKRAIAQGVGRDGRHLEAPMPFAWYAGIRDDDLDAIVAYLRTLPAR